MPAAPGQFLIQLIFYLCVVTGRSCATLPMTVHTFFLRKPILS